MRTCVECRGRNRSVHLRIRYGVAQEDYAMLLAAQDGGCGICGATTSGGRSHWLHVDHCHDSDRVRGLLCRKCNVALGYLGDTLAGLMRAVRYLEDSEARR